MSQHRIGVIAGLVSYVIWGLFPLFWPLVEPAGAPEILAHRILWSLAFLVVVLVFTAGFRWLRTVGRRRLLQLVRGGRAHHRELGRVHLRGEQRPRRRQRAGLLHQPARERRARAPRPARAPPPPPADRGAHRPARRGGAHDRVRQAALDRAHPRLLVRDVRPREEAGGARRDAEPVRGDRDPRGPGARLHRGRRAEGDRDVHGGRPRPLAAAHGGGRRDGRAAHPLRRRGDPHPAQHDRPHAVHRADDALRHRRRDLRRGDAGGAGSPGSCSSGSRSSC